MQVGVLSKIKNRMANSVDPDETAHYKPSHLIRIVCTVVGFLYNVPTRLKGLKFILYPSESVHPFFSRHCF